MNNETKEEKSGINFEDAATMNYYKNREEEREGERERRGVGWRIKRK